MFYIFFCCYKISIVARQPHSRGYVKGDNVCNVLEQPGLLMFSTRILIDGVCHWPAEAKQLNHVIKKKSMDSLFSHSAPEYIFLGITFFYSLLHNNSLATDPEAQVRFPALPGEKKVVSLERGSTQPREYN
jgi:hypothetical protein